jgi:hypothetical protein
MIAEGASVERDVFVTNCTAEPAQIMVELPDTLSGLSVTSAPMSQIVAPGEKKLFHLVFNLSASRVRKEEPLLYICITVAKTMAVSRPGQQKVAEVPYVMPFTFSLPTPAQPVVSDEVAMSTLAPVLAKSAPIAVLSPGTVLSRVEFGGRAMLAKTISVPEADKGIVRTQLAALAGIRHEAVVRVEKYAVDEEHGTVTVLLPDLTQGRDRVRTLRNVLLSDEGARVTWEQILKIAKDIAAGIDFLQRSNLTYNRLTPDSVVLQTTADSTVRAMICSVGKTSDGECVTQVSCPQPDAVSITPPEVLARELLLADCAAAEGNAPAVKTPKTRSGDTFDFAMLLYLLCSRVAPFSDTRAQWKDISTLEQRVLNNEFRPSLYLVPHECPAGLRQLAVQCWEGATLRPTPAEILDSLRIVDLNETSRTMPRSGPVNDGRKSREDSPADESGLAHTRAGQ